MTDSDNQYTPFPAGNTVAMVGLDQFITKNATLTNEKAEDAHPIKAPTYFAPECSPVIHSIGRSPSQCKIREKAIILVGFDADAKSYTV